MTDDHSGSAAENAARLNRVGIGYTLATGRLFCDVALFHEYAEQLLARPVWTHEFGDAALWDEMRKRYEALITELGASEASAREARFPNQGLGEG